MKGAEKVASRNAPSSRSCWDLSWPIRSERTYSTEVLSWLSPPSTEAMDRYVLPENSHPIRGKEFERLGRREKGTVAKTHWKFVAVYRERSRPVAFEKIAPFYPRISQQLFEIL